jgi:hypothetical protein
LLQAFVYNEVAILVRHWFEVSLQDSHLEHGARVELRLRTAQPHRGTESAAQRIVADQPLWRADLFDRVDGVRGGFEAAHYHPRFVGVEPCERHWADIVKAAPWDWLHERMSDIAAVVAESVPARSVPAADVEQVRADAPMIVAAAQSRAATRCDSTEQCHAWTQDAAHSVHLMLDRLDRPELLDRDRVAPWLESRPAR